MCFYARLLENYFIVNAFLVLNRETETRHLSPYTDMLLTNKKNMRRALFVEVIMDPKKTCHYTGIFDIQGICSLSVHLYFIPQMKDTTW